MTSQPVSFTCGRSRARALALLTILGLSLPLLVAGTKPPSYSPREYAALKQKVESTPAEKIDAEFLREIYRGFPGAKYMLKEILADPALKARNERMGRVRRSLDLQFWGRVARLKGITIELTDQGKADGHRSDLDETGWALVGPKGELVQRGRPFDELRRMHEDFFAREYGIAPEQADITVMDGDIFLPDYRSAHMGSEEFVRDLSDKVYRLRRNSAAYFVPGANKQQVYNRALSEGRTIHISWDPMSGRTLVNGMALDVEAYIEGKMTIGEMAARQGAVRYRGVSAVEPQWRLALGNAVQNLREFLGSSSQSIVRQKYANRVVEEAFGPMTGQMGKYSLIHGGLPVLDEKGNRISSDDWKRNFTDQIYGVSSGPEFEEIKRILDVSADIELDKTGKRASGEKFDYKTRRSYYYRAELEDARRLLREETGSEPGEEKVLEKAEQLFVSKNARVLAKGIVPVLKETLKRDLTAEGRRRYRADFGENYRATVKKMLFERKIEIAVLFESLELIHDSDLRNSLRKELLEAAPNMEIRSLLERLSGLAAIDGGIDEWLKEAGRRSPPQKPEEILAEMERRKAAAVGNEDGSRISTETMESKILERISARLGPKDGGDFLEAYQQMKAAARGFPSKYMNEFYEGLSPLLVSSTALNLVRTYQQDCLLGGKSGWDCSKSLLAAGAQEGLFYLPRLNTPFLIFSSLKSINEGNSEGFLTLGLGVAALKGFSSGMHLYFIYQIGKAGLEVTYGYALQAMEADQVQQAFTAMPEPGKQARRNPHAEPAGTFAGDTPTFPLLREIDVPANRWSEGEKMREAERMFATPILEELQRKGLKPDSAEWEQLRQRLLRRYAFELPYYQRSEKIYQHFNPLIERYIADASSQGKDLADYSYTTFEACMEANKASKESPVPQCLARAVEETSPVLDAFFNQYLEEWLKKQSEGYQMEYSSTLDRLLFRDSYRQEMFHKLKTVLIRDYTLHQWMDRRRQEANQEMERQINQLLPKLKRLAELERSRIAATEKASQSFLEKYEAMSAQLYAQPLPPMKPVVRVIWPDIARRVGSPGPIVDVNVQGEYSSDENSPKDDWFAEMKAQVVAVRDDPPPNLLRTAEIEEQLKPPADGKRPKKIITIEDEVEVVVKSKAGDVLGSEKGMIYWYDIVEEPGPFKGMISVTVREEIPAKPETEWPVYAGAAVAVEKQVRNSDLWGTANFEVARDGSFEIEVKPREGDKSHKPGKGSAVLADPLNQEDSGEQQARGKSSADVVVTLGYQEPPRDTPTPTNAGRVNAPAGGSGGLPGARGAPSGPPGADFPQAAECTALLNSARSVLQRHNAALAASLVAEARQKNCGEVPGLADALAQIRRNMQIEQGCNDIQVLEDACRFEAALQLAQSLESQAPDASCLKGKTSRLQELVRGKANTLNLLRAAENASRAEDLRGTLGLLRQSLSTAPACLAELIKPVIAALEQEIAQLPAWLELVSPEKPAPGQANAGAIPAWLSAGGETRKPGTDPDDAINQARNTLNRDRNQAELHQLEADRLRLEQERRKLEQARIAANQSQTEQPNNAPQAGSPSEQTNTRTGGGKGKWNALSNLINGVATAVLNSHAPAAGGLIPNFPGRLPSTSGGGGAEGFEGVWEGYGTLTSHRQGSVLGGNNSMVAIFSPQKDLTFRISRSGNGFILEVPGGARSANRYVNGNKIGFVGEDSMEVSKRVDFVITIDLELNGNQMTGTMRLEGSDGTMAVRSVNCRRQ